MVVSECALQIQRDLRSAEREFKRDKDLAAKWSHGVRLPHGVDKHDLQVPVIDAGEGVNIRLRPSKRLSETFQGRKRDRSTMKGRHSWDMPPNRGRRAAHVKAEIEESPMTKSLLELIPSAATEHSITARKAHYDDNDIIDLHLRPLALGHFVKITGRETEQLVEKEYEILDVNGQPLKGRKARQNLRCGSNHGLRDEDGFEMI